MRAEGPTHASCGVVKGEPTYSLCSVHTSPSLLPMTTMATKGDDKIERGLNYESMQDERHYKKVQLRLDDLVLPRLLALALPLHLSHPLHVHFPTHSAPSPTTTRASLTLL
jgi:hypothetical protein